MSTKTRNSQHHVIFAQGLFLALVIIIGNSSATLAKTFTVSNMASLIAALNYAQDETINPGWDTIAISPGVYTVTTAQIGTTNAFPKITTKVSILGLVNGAEINRASTAPAFRFFEIGPTGQLVLDRLTLKYGQANIFGGAILNHGSLTVTSCFLDNNKVTNSSGPALGGAIYNDAGKVVIRKSSLRGNEASMGGGFSSDSSMTNQVAQVTIENSALVENYARNNGYFALGGGVFLRGANEVVIHDSTFTFNGSQQYGGAIAFQAIPKTNRVSLRNLTVVNNRATLEGGGFWYDCGVMTPANAAPIEMANTILTGNSAPSPTSRDFGGNGTYKSLGRNIYGLGSGFVPLSDYLVLSFLPTELEWRGNPSGKPGGEHYLPKLGWGVAKGDLSLAAATDQLGTARKTPCDIGAVEHLQVAPPPPPPTTGGAVLKEAKEKTDAEKCKERGGTWLIDKLGNGFCMEKLPYDDFKLPKDTLQ